MALADKMRAAVASKKIINRSNGQQLGTITVLIGVAERLAGQPGLDAVERAHVCLAAAKQAGRNRVSG